jgi:hypothetical protein
VFSWLKTKKLPVPATAEATPKFVYTRVDPDRESIATRERIEAAALKAEEKVLAEAPDKLKRFQDAYDNDVRNYSFTSERIGDFLIVVVTRYIIFYLKSDEEGYRLVSKHKSEQTAINLSRVKRITFLPGHPPDNDGVTFYKGYALDDITPRTDDLTFRSGGIFSELEKPMPYNGYLEGKLRAKHVTRNTPRSAVDDRIFFDGLDLYLHAPAPVGAAVLVKIHAELAKGSTPNVKVYEPKKDDDA